MMPMTQSFGITAAEKSTAMVELALRQDPEMLQQMQMESGLWYSNEERQFYMDSRQAAQDFSQNAWMLLQEKIMMHYDWFNRFHENGDESMRYVGAEQLSDNDKQQIYLEGRKPYEIDFITDAINNIRGEQIGNQTEWNAVPTLPTMNGQQYADIANHYLKWVAQSNGSQWKRVSSACFRDVLVRAVGIAGVRMDPNNSMAAIEIQHMRPQEFMWDIASTLDGELNGTEFLIRRYTRTKADLAAEFREWSFDIMKMSAGLATGYGPYDFFYNMLKPRAGALANRWELPLEFNPTIQMVWGGRLPVCELLHRRRVARWCVEDGIASKTYTFDTPQMAFQGRQMLWDYWVNSGMLQVMGLTQPALSAVEPRNIAVLDQYTYVGNIMVRLLSEETEEFPYKFCIPDWYDGNMTSLIDREKPKQRIVNRLFSHLDQWAASMKQQGIVDIGMLHDAMDAEEVQEAFTQPGKAWVVDSTGKPNFDPNKVVTITKAPEVQQMVMPYMQLIMSQMKGAFGGAVQIGQADYAGQSGTSQEVLRSAGATGRMYLYDSFQMFTEKVGRQVLKYAPYLDPVTRMTVVNEAGKPEIASFLEAGFTSFSELDFKVVVSEKRVNPSEQARRYRDIITLLGQMPDAAPDFMPLLLKYMDVPYNDKQQVMQSMQARQQQQQQLEERAQQLSEQAQLTKDTVLKGNLMLKAGELDLAARNLTKFAAVWKAPNTPEMLQAMLNQGGVDANALTIASSLASNAMMEQDIRDVAQVHEQALMSPEQKQFAAAKALSAATAVKNTSQKDKVARSQKGSENT